MNKIKEPLEFERVVPPVEAAHMLNVGKTTLYELERDDPDFPPKVQVTTKKVGYRYSDLVAYINKKVLLGETL